MAILIKTQHPTQLLRRLNDAINNGDVQTWQVDNDGDYTISRLQWFQCAWIRPYIKNEQLIFGIVQSSNYPMTRQLYGVYHGRFVATLLSHFDFMIDNVEISPLMVEGYDISTND